MCIVTPLVTLCMLFGLIGKLVNVCQGKGLISDAVSLSYYIFLRSLTLLCSLK